ncbi:MAG TPA: hypothetical protein DEP51_03200 [Clostridiales bacterium]|nr:hypothetical protein [Clostridiales bacterium]
MKEILKELKNAFALGWYKFRKALEWIDSKIPEGSGNNSDERFIGMEECKQKDFNGTCSNLQEVYSNEFIKFMEDAAFRNDRSNSLKSKEKER